MGAVGTTFPRSRAPASVIKGARDSRGKAACVQDAIRRSVRECREALGTLVSRVEPKTPRDVHAAKAAERAGNARGTGERSIIQVAEVGRTHRAPCPPEDRKVLWWHEQAGR